MSLPLLDCLAHVTDDQGGKFFCPKGVCGNGPLASTLGADRVWVCDECGARSLSWRLSPEHLKKEPQGE